MDRVPSSPPPASPAGWINAPTNRLAAFLVASGLLSGLAFHFAIGEESRVFSWLPGAVSAQWLPGFIYGVAFAVAMRQKLVPALLFATLSGVNYYVATLAFLYVDNGIAGIVGGGMAGACAGLVGALLLLVITSVISDRRAAKGWSFKIVLAGLLGGTYLGVTGNIPGGAAWVLPMWLAGWAIWQVSVGLLITKGLQAGTQREHARGSFEQRLLAGLSGPVAQLVGLIGAIVSIASVLELFT